MLIIPMTTIVVVFNLTTEVKLAPALGGIAAIVLLYGINRLLNDDRLMTYLALGIGLVVILLNANNTAVPYVEYNFLLYLPLLSSVMLSLRETVLVAVISFACLLIFGSVRADLSGPLLRDLLVFNGISQAFIIFVALQRNRLDGERQRLAAESSRAALMNELITNLSHDFRTPLSIINTSAYLLVQPADAAKRQTRVDHIMEQTSRLDAILEDILFISRLGQIETQSMMEIDMNALITEVVRTAEPKAQARQVQLALHLQADKLLIRGREDHLRRAVENIMDNALRHTPSGGSISLQTIRSGHTITVKIDDNGAGIAPEDMPRIFEPFFRGDRSRALDTGGAGLGLSIAKRIIEIYGGVIRVESQTQIGSSFQIEFPVASQPRRRPRS